MTNNDFTRDMEEHIEKRLFESGKIIVLYGARQVGKTTLARKVLRNHDSDRGYFNCEEQPVVDALASYNSSTMKSFFGSHQVIVLDEAQTVENIGRALKILIDAYPEMNIIATGSSSFDLANKINEPLTGRKYEFLLYPMSIKEIADNFDGNRAIIETLNQRLIYGNYPEILAAESIDDAREKLKNLTTSYLYRDVFKFSGIQNPSVLSKILRALAFQVGGEVSFNEIAALVGIDKNTVARYIRLLEQAFIIFPLASFARNLRNEIKRGKKYYFYDTGVITALTENYAPADSGRDMGGIWENFMISERLKYNQRRNLYKNLYFWRLKGSGEIDLIEEFDGNLHPFEFKWNKGKPSVSTYNFTNEYKNSDKIRVVTRHDFLDFVI
jgi:predicted AAA+ superfamily ATPase